MSLPPEDYSVNIGQGHNGISASPCLALPPCFLKFYDTKIPYNLQGFWHLSFPILQFIVPKGFHHKVLETLCT